MIGWSALDRPEGQLTNALNRSGHADVVSGWHLPSAAEIRQCEVAGRRCHASHLRPAYRSPPVPRPRSASRVPDRPDYPSSNRSWNSFSLNYKRQAPYITDFAFNGNSNPHCGIHPAIMNPAHPEGRTMSWSPVHVSLYPGEACETSCCTRIPQPAKQHPGDCRGPPRAPSRHGSGCSHIRASSTWESSRSGSGLPRRWRRLA